MPRLRITLAIALLVPIALYSEQPPSLVSLAPDTAVTLVGRAQRVYLLGGVPLYEVALYSESANATDALRAPEVAKALRIEIVAEDDLPHRISLEWRTELLPPLNPAATMHLRNAFAALRRGDVVMVEYTPRTGTVVKMERTLVVPKAEHDLMLAFLDHWLGQRPLSEEMKRRLLGSGG